jgi:pimeloyl-ACP methyl ester carboxylesterase
MKKIFSACAALALMSAGAARAEDAAGDWAGVLMGQLHVIIHLERTGDGKWSGTLQSPDQGPTKIPVDTVEATPDHLKFTVPAIHGSYDGTWDDAKKEWEGTWYQGASLPLVLHRGTTAPAAPQNRPQEEAIAKGPLPYSNEAVAFPNTASAGVTLKGTFSKPTGAGPFPTVVLVSGSGANTRDENVFNHKIFLVLADYLNRQGLAVLRYDKRGVGESTGNYGAATSAEFISDARAAVTYLRTRTDVDPRHIGLAGHSEGGLIVPAVAAADPGVGFIVLLSGPGLRGDRVLLVQGDLLARAAGATEAQIAVSHAQRAKAFAVIEASQDASDAKTQLEALMAKSIASGASKKADADQAIAQLTNPWMYSFLRYDPVPALQKVRIPVLALGGSLDLQVEAKENLAAIKTALKDDKDVTVTELPGLNHLFQDARTGGLDEYGTIEETVSPMALKTVGDWITAHVK